MRDVHCAIHRILQANTLGWVNFSLFKTKRCQQGAVLYLFEAGVMTRTLLLQEAVSMGMVVSCAEEKSFARDSHTATDEQVTRLATRPLCQMPAQQAAGNGNENSVAGCAHHRHGPHQVNGIRARVYATRSVDVFASPAVRTNIARSHHIDLLCYCCLMY